MKKWRKRAFFLKMVKMTLIEGKMLTYNFVFRINLSNFSAENTVRSEPHIAKKGYQNHYKKLSYVQKRTFGHIFTKIVKYTMSW